MALKKTLFGGRAVRGSTTNTPRDRGRANSGRNLHTHNDALKSEPRLLPKHGETVLAKKYIAAWLLEK